ncbi:phage minor tail protein L [Phenylobacterium sp.]|uniref:phage minor tail protein L n=1 Tax=Phenylobacterium sp. TaxID=1871053 RepID=UPI000C993C22|nr:phage minor tail protein L [Phenylobacterium sp.]MAK80455.1 phage minor tail protein L [Phenylobacterium sp.]|tara:strand:- start:547 stop:1386 length:840 start_codon:yes stop_codon:yes gene_type:complete
MISLDGTFVINSSATQQLIVTITAHPFKDGDALKFSSTHAQLTHWGDNYIVVVEDSNTIKFQVPEDDPANKTSNTITQLNGETGDCTITSLSIQIPASKAVSPELQSLEPSAEIELFKLTFNKKVNGLTEDDADVVYYYHAGTNEIKTNILFNTQSYEPLPVKVTGFNKTTKGTLPRPKFEIANTNSAISALLLLYNPIHAELLRIKTCKKFLDAENFTSGSNSSADPTAIFEADDRWYVDRIVNENPVTVVFELTGKIDMTNLRLPKRRFRETKVKIQ